MRQSDQTKTPSVVAAVVVAGGRGARMGGGVPKQYRAFSGKPVIRASLEAFSTHPAVAYVQPVIHPEDAQLYLMAARGLSARDPVTGGATRQESVLAGLEALAPAKPDFVLVHDAARPFASPALVSTVLHAAFEHGAAVPGLPVTDTVKVVGAAACVETTLDRTRLRAIQTPQAFRFEPLLEAHRRAKAQGRSDFPDDAALVEWAGMAVRVVEGEPGNVKLTTPEDFGRVQSAPVLADMRTATGFDVHTFGPGDHVMLGGVRIAHTRALVGHSDADVVLHALTDAILGGLAEGDIGQHFPPTDERWRGATSDRFLAFAAERVRIRGGRISLLDATILCERPKIGPHRDAMRTRIAEIAGISAERVAVKATTTEQLGFLGREEGIAALATATLRLPGNGDE